MKINKLFHNGVIYYICGSNIFLYDAHAVDPAT